MKNENSLKNIYGLKYDSSNIQSGLIKWYNRVIDKSIDELDVVDVSKMIRQDILKDVAIDRAIELFFIGPFEGEIEDGDLLKLLVSYGAEVVKNKKSKNLMTMLLKLENEFKEFDWADENSKTIFRKNIVALKEILLKTI